MLSSIATQHRLFPLYTDEKLALKNFCSQCSPVFQFEKPSSINLQMIFPSGATISDSEIVPVSPGCNLATTGGIAINTKNVDLDGDGEDETIFEVFNIFSGLGPQRGKAYCMNFTVNGTKYYSETFCITGKAPCWKLHYWNDCDNMMGCYSDGFRNTLEIHDDKGIDFYPSGKVDTGTTKKDIFDDDIRIRTKVRQLYSFQICVTDPVMAGLNMIDSFDNVVLENGLSGEMFAMNDISVSSNGTPSDCEYIATIQFSYGAAIQTICCDSVYEDNVIDPCVTDPVDCSDFAVSISESGDVLTADITSQPSDCQLTYQWLLIPANGGGTTSVGNTASINKTQFGTYVLNVNCGDCFATSQFYCPDPCAFSLGLEKGEGGVLNAVVTGDGNFSYEWLYSDDPDNPVGGAAQGSASSSAYVPQETGYYTVKVCNTDESDCCKQFTVFCEVDEVDECEDLTVLINQVDSILSAEVQDCDQMPTYSWTYDDGTGPTEISTTQDVMTLGNGLYALTVNCGDCETIVQKLIMDIEDECINVIIKEPIEFDFPDDACLDVRVKDPIQIDGGLTIVNDPENPIVVVTDPENPINITNDPNNPIHVTGDFCCDETDECDCVPQLGECQDCIPPGVTNCPGWTATWYSDPAKQNVVTIFADDVDQMYYYTLTKPGCEAVDGEYFHDAPQVGDPDIIIDL